MKYKSLISIVLALVMLCSTSASVLAYGSPVRGELSMMVAGVTGSGKYALQATNNNNVKVTITLVDVRAGSYDVYIISDTPGVIYNQSVGVFEVSENSRRIRFVAKSSPPPAFEPGEVHFQVRVYRSEGGVYWDEDNPGTITFK